METLCTFLFVLVFLVISHQNITQEAQKKTRDPAVSGIAISATYVGLLAFDGTVSTGVLNPAIAFALVLYQKIGNWQSQPNATILTDETRLNLNKCITPFLGGILAAILFLWQKTMMVNKELNYSKDALRGSI